MMPHSLSLRLATQVYRLERLVFFLSCSKVLFACTCLSISFIVTPVD
uniref:Uncharacterized protein n=1 Tax=Arundo donax TaxID=35708 RepID=A0A0A9I242_ARUDO